MCLWLTVPCRMVDVKGIMAPFIFGNLPSKFRRRKYFPGLLPIIFYLIGDQLYFLNKNEEIPTWYFM